MDPNLLASFVEGKGRSYKLATYKHLFYCPIPGRNKILIIIYDSKISVARVSLKCVIDYYLFIIPRQSIMVFIISWVKI